MATIEVPETRFARQLVPSNFLDRLQVSTKRTEVFIRHVSQDYQIRRLGYHGELKADPQFQGSITFSSDDGVTFSDPLVNPEANRVHQIRLSLTQHEVRPLLRGFRIDWFLPSGWVWTDTLGTTTYEEVVSNPTIATRVMRSPANPQPVGFRILIVERFQ